jgi:hypothetical protein
MARIVKDKITCIITPTGSDLPSETDDDFKSESGGSVPEQKTKVLVTLQ